MNLPLMRFRPTAQPGQRDGGSAGFALAPLPKVTSGKAPSADAQLEPAVMPAASPGGGAGPAGKGGADALDNSDIAEDIEYDDDFEDLADADDGAEPAGRGEEDSAARHGMAWSDAHAVVRRPL
jgi:hypothetical protein